LSKKTLKGMPKKVYHLLPNEKPKLCIFDNLPKTTIIQLLYQFLDLDDMRNLSVANIRMYESLYTMAKDKEIFPITFRELNKSVKAEA